MLGLKIEIKVNGIGFLLERANLATDIMHIKGDFDQIRFPVGAISPTTLTKIAWPKCSYNKARISQI